MKFDLSDNPKTRILFAALQLDDLWRIFTVCCILLNKKWLTEIIQLLDKLMSLNDYKLEWITNISYYDRCMLISAVSS